MMQCKQCRYYGKMCQWCEDRQFTKQIEHEIWLIDNETADHCKKCGANWYGLLEAIPSEKDKRYCDKCTLLK